MDVSQMQKLPGMPSGFPFAMVLVGILLCVFVGLVGSIEGAFFRVLSGVFQGLGEALIVWGAVLQGVHWVCAAFARRSAPPAA
jgi:hypothetical protein